MRSFIGSVAGRGLGALRGLVARTRRTRPLPPEHPPPATPDPPVRSDRAVRSDPAVRSDRAVRSDPAERSDATVRSDPAERSDATVRSDPPVQPDATGDPTGPSPAVDRSASAGAAVERADAPAPDDPRKPASPPDLRRPSWGYALRTTLREFRADNVPDLAAALTYWAVLAVFPAILALVSVLGLFSDARAVVDSVMEIVRDLAPGTNLDAIRPVVENLASQERAGLALAGGLLVALWSASGYVAAFSRAMNRIYEIDEGRPFWKLRPILLLVTLATVLIAAVTLAALVLTGPVAEAIGGVVGLSDVALGVWNVAKWPVVVLLVTLVIAVLYYWTPNVRQPRFRWVSVGAFVAILVWAVVTAGFGLYVTYAASYGNTYGSLAGVIVFLLWIWITNNALLFGAEVDAELERARQLQAGIPAEETLQLPPRDTQASAKQRAKVEQDIAAGRELRMTRGRSADPAG